MRPHPKRTRTDPTYPEAWGTCDRSGFITNQKDLQWQMEWQGTRLINLKILVAPDQYDMPQRQLGTIVLPPDPVSILNARVEPYNVEEYTQRLTMSGQTRYTMSGTTRIESNAQTTYNYVGGADFLTTQSGQQGLETP